MADDAGSGWYFVDVPPGAHVSESRVTSGSYRALLRDDETNDLLGPPEMSRRDLDGDVDGEEARREQTVSRDAVLVLAGVVAALGVVKAASHVRRWWREHAPGALGGKAATTEAPATPEEARKAGDLAIGEIPLSEASAAEFSAAVETVLEDCRTSMSSQEAYRHLAEMLAASVVFAQKARLLSGVQLGDAAQAPELAEALGNITHQQVISGVNRMLEADPACLDEQMSAVLLAAFGGGCVVDGEYLPLRSDRVREVLSIDPRP